MTASTTRFIFTRSKSASTSGSGSYGEIARSSGTKGRSESAFNHQGLHAYPPALQHRRNCNVADPGDACQFLFIQTADKHLSCQLVGVDTMPCHSSYLLTS